MFQLLNCENKTVLQFLKQGGKFLFCDDDPYKYFLPHLKNTAHFPTSALRSTQRSVPVQFNSQKINSEIIKNAGLNCNDAICMYGDANLDDVLLSCSLVVFELLRFGFKNLFILNGDYKKLDDKLKDQEYPEWKSNGKFKYNSDMVFDIDDLLENYNELTIIDARPPTRYGPEITDKRWKVNGNIPGSINVWWKTFIDPKNNHCFKPIEEIVDILIEKGLNDLEENILIYCGTGREATMQYLFLKHIIDFENVFIYLGSWNEYHYKYSKGKILPINKKGGYIKKIMF